ncbi:MAG TPA: PD-(D/E)XK nuclease family protein [Acidimicrobiales bacterium]|nr:PD-(D/E)XK nuclease family protein [Acidimicrobiales bacterium]
MGYSLPSTLSPSKLTKFMSCPLAFRFSYLDHLPEPPSIHLVRGTLVHKVLELLLGTAIAEARTHARADVALDEAWEALADPEIASLGLDDLGLATFRREAAALVARYFTVEDPTTVRPIGIELDLRAELDGVELRGIIDRLDRLEDGELVIVDYKTGRAPRPEHARARMVGVHFYALLCEQVLGRVPSEVRLMYLRDPIVVTESPNAQTIRGVRQRALAVWTAIERACDRDDFRPSPSRLCGSCAFQQHCPAFGGDPERARGDLGPASAAEVAPLAG